MRKHRNKIKALNKKGSGVLDTFYIGLFLLIFGIISVVSYSIMSQVQPALDSHTDNDVSRNATNNGLNAIKNLDKVAFMIIIGLLIAAIISAYYIDSHPVFFVASVLLLLLMMIVVPVLSNVFDKFKTNSMVSTAADQFTITSTFFDAWPTYFVIMSLIVLVALYAKYRSGGGAV